jgi:hypothetical protein
MKLTRLFAVFLFYLLTTCDVPKGKEPKEPTAETVGNIRRFKRSSIQRVTVNLTAIKALIPLIEHENPRDKAKHQRQITALKLKNIELKNKITRYRFKDQASWLEFRNKTSEELAQKETDLKLLQNNID